MREQNNVDWSTRLEGSGGSFFIKKMKMKNNIQVFLVVYLGQTLAVNIVGLADIARDKQQVALDRSKVPEKRFRFIFQT